jgi:hypothetical protein
VLLVTLQLPVRRHGGALLRVPQAEAGEVGGKLAPGGPLVDVLFPPGAVDGLRQILQQEQRP